MKTKSEFRYALCVVLIIAQLVLPLGARANVGILGGLGTVGESERTYEILEHRLQKYLEDSPTRRMKIATVQGTESEHRTQLELERLQLQQASEEMLSFVSRRQAPGNGSLRIRVKQLLEKLAGVDAFGPELQTAYVAMALDVLHYGRPAEARVFLTQAKRLHPEGKLAARMPWTWDASQDRAALEAMWSELSQPTLSCRLSWYGAVAEASVFVNGFRFAGDTVSVVPGTRVNISQRKGTDEISNQYASCSGTGARSVKLESAPIIALGWNEARKATLAKISQRHSIATLLVLDKVEATVGADADEYRLYLFTPGLGLDQVPVQRPLRSNEIRKNSALPIEWNGFQQLVEKHQRQVTRLAGLGDVAMPVQTGDELPGARSDLDATPWYRQTTTWVVAGALFAGITVAILASRSAAPVQNSTSSSSAANSGFKINLD